MRFILPILVFGLALNVSSPQLAEAGTANPGFSGKLVNAASCNIADVQRALNQARDGDTVVIPAGICTWTGRTFIRYTVAGALTIQGAGDQKVVGGGDKTVIIDDLERRGINDIPLLAITTVAGKAFRL